MTSPLFVTGVIASYMIFVKVLGPRYMADRKPYSLKLPMLVYNFLMVLINLALIWEVITLKYIILPITYKYYQ